MAREMKKNVRRNEYSIVIIIAFVIVLSFIIICPDIQREIKILIYSIIINPYLFAFGPVTNLFNTEIMNPGIGEIRSDM